MSLLEARGLTMRRGARTILDRVEAHFEAGGFTAVIGPNGAGKSTLLTLLAGLAKPGVGAVTLDGQPLAAIDRRSLAKRRAFLPQNPRAEWPIAVERLVALGLTPELPALGGLPESFGPRIEKVLADCDLLARRGQPVATLSGGELARAMLARALVSDPEILIADEPLAGLDPRHALDSLQRLKALAGIGRTVIAAVHDLTLAARYADRLLALKDGRVVAFGPMRETLTPALLRDLFQVEAEVTGEGETARVDFG